MIGVPQVAQTDFWDRLLSQNNIQLLILVALGVFIYFRAWPLLEKRLEANDKQRQAEQERFVAALNQVTEKHATEMKEVSAAQQAQNMAINNLTQSIDTLVRIRTEERGTRRQ